ncbi:unnamed protein product [Pieris macdunnoughi]|uniref:ATP-dependent DNA helicase n=1 Tax=Pieris macdunnoughi TaxID=345717 RepID=A0A821WV91_9NEOP|nr:unnamed protein product [Pieris macdunnoughi]
MYDIKVDESFFNDNQIHDEIPQDDFSEHIPVEDSLTAQQQTLLWNEEHYLRIAPGEDNVPQSLLFDEHAEELSFPAIYLGQFRNFRDGVKVTPFMMASSELRRSDRRAVTPLDMQKVIEISRNLCREDGLNDEPEVQNVANIASEPNPFQNLYNNPLSEMNSDLRLAVLNKLGTIAKKRENLMPNTEFYELMRMANDKQKELLLHVISNLLNPNRSPFQIFFTGPAGCGKTFVIKLIMEIYNRYNENDGCCNSYIPCASTGKAAVAIDGTTVHTALKISLSRLLPLSTEVAHQYRALFKYVKVLIIDEISMIGAELLSQIDSRLKQITGDFKTNFGGLDVILIGDLRQLPPVRATPIYKQQKQKIVGPILWRGFRFFELDQVMRQANQEFSSILTKIGNGQQLNDQELILLESRFVTMQEAEEKCPHGIRLFNTNKDVTKYNNRILSTAPNKTTSIAKDVFVGCTSAEQTAFVRQKLYKMSLIDTGGLPYETVFVPNVFYMITTNIDVSDGLANGAVGKLVHLEFNDEGDLHNVADNLKTNTVRTDAMYTTSTLGSNRNFECNQCEFETSKQSIIHRHIKSHFSILIKASEKPNDVLEKKFNCKLCSGSFTDATSLSKHIVSSHIKVIET